MKKLVLATLAIIASLFTGCSQATSPESNIYEGMMTCEEAQALYNQASHQVTLYYEFIAESEAAGYDDYDAYTSGLHKSSLARAKAAVEANCN